MATRTVYACEVCQPLRLEAGTELDPARAKALSASGPTKQFKSHCAPEASTQVKLFSQTALLVCPAEAVMFEGPELSIGGDINTLWKPPSVIIDAPQLCLGVVHVCN